MGHKMLLLTIIVNNITTNDFSLAKGQFRKIRLNTKQPTNCRINSKVEYNAHEINIVIQITGTSLEM